MMRRRMTLSACLLTTDPAPRVAATLKPLRGLADEVVIAADSRIDQSTLAGYASLADKLFQLDFRLYERHLAWLHAQCSGDWILRLDGDEVPSRAFVERLPELVSRSDLDQVWVRRAWLHGDARHELTDLPWSTDYLNRLVRNAPGLRFPGRQHMHAAPRAPAAYVEEPVYHLELLLADEDSRRAKAIRYEVAHPNIVAPGGGRLNEAFYLPELRTSPPARREVPLEDLALLRAAVAADAELVPGDPGRARAIPLVESDALWEGRIVPDQDHRATLAALEADVRFGCGERRPLMVAVTNCGGTHWPGGLEAAPMIRLSYRWHHEDGSVLVPEGLRTPFPGPVAPGERVVVPVDVAAPTEAGRFLLSVDVVHEHVRWFGAGCEIPVWVANVAVLPPAGVRLRERRGALHRSRRRMLIPRVIHRIWLGDDPVPESVRALGRTFRQHHLGWRLRLWRDDDMMDLGIDAERAFARTASELSNVARYQILARHGGVYVDTDVECRRRFTPLLRGLTAFAALEAPGRVGTAVLGAVPGHRAFQRAATEARKTVGTGLQSVDSTGPYFFSLLLEEEPDVTILGADTFYPYRWDQMERAGDHFPDAYAVHRWNQSWAKSPV
jgi:hypothetical protein